MKRSRVTAAWFAAVSNSLALLGPVAGFAASPWTELFRYGKLQLGVVRGSGGAFNLPASSPDALSMANKEG